MSNCRIVQYAKATERSLRFVLSGYFTCFFRLTLIPGLPISARQKTGCEFFNKIRLSNIYDIELKDFTSISWLPHEIYYSGMSVWPYWRLFWENVNCDYLTLLTNESDNTKRIKNKKRFKKNTKIFEKYITVYQNNFSRFIPSFDQIDILPSCKNQIVVREAFKNYLADFVR